ncbi:hypothetical protein [Mycoplasmopsis glycophila]|nr:hypothetical protein [Mycoplasmopsis glycophila]
MLIILATLIFFILAILIFEAISYSQYLVEDKRLILAKLIEENKSKEPGKQLATDDATVWALSPGYALKTIFYSLELSALGFMFVAFVFTIWILINLFTNKYNGDKYFRILYYTTTIAFALIFFTISVQPQPTYFARQKIEIIDGAKYSIDIKETIHVISYKWFWIALFGTFISLIISIVAKKKLGYLTKSKFLNTRFAETKKLKEQIRVIEEQ